MNKFLRISGVLILLSTAIQAQDFHFSQFYNFTTAINPAMAGRMREDIRVGLIYRNQWKQVNSPYTTFGVAADMNFVNVPAFLDKLGATVMLINDEMPDKIFKNQFVYVGLAAHKSLDAFKRHRISLGVQPGFAQKSFNSSGLFSTEDIDRNNFTTPTGSFTSADQGISGNNKSSAFSLNAGLFYDYKISERLTIGLGASMFNITAPKESVVKNTLFSYDPARLGRKIVGTASASIAVHKKISLLPAVMYATQSGATDLNMGAALGYHFNSTKDITLFLGSWYRLGDAIIPMIGMQYKNFRGAFSYDATHSSLTDVKKIPSINASSLGAYEFTITYVGFLSRALPNDVTVPCRFF
jgi:type IX secretion system PorP/SprF family membrane protein